MCLHMRQLSRAARDVSRFASVFLVDIDEPAVQTYVRYFDITIHPCTVFFFNCEHVKMDCNTQDHSKFIGAFKDKQDVIDVLEVLYKCAMRGKHIVECPLPKERIPQFQLLYKEV
mmetsp:Transcript_30436/g.57365  ORF Transcript_30436/g.57365 Transcript_30436/m.57365 type:complete len:115 (+) Transcript_30436:362-706(+)